MKREKNISKEKKEDWIEDWHTFLVHYAIPDSPFTEDSINFIKNTLSVQETQIEKRLSKLEKIRCDEAMKAQKKATLKEIEKMRKWKEDGIFIESDNYFNSVLDKIINKLKSK